MRKVKELLLAQDYIPPVNTDAMGSIPDPGFFDNSIEWLTSREAAEYLRISTKTLLNLVSNGKIPFYKLGRRNRYLESELRKALLAEPRGGLNGL